MPVPQGIDSVLQFGLESAWGTIATVGRSVNFESESITGHQPLIPNLALGGDANQRDSIVGRIDANGSIDLKATIDNLPLLAYAALGNLAVSGAGDPYTHTDKTTSGALPSYTIQVLYDMATDQYKQMIGSRVDTVSFDIGDEGYWMWKMGWCGKSTTLATSTFASPTDWTTSTPLEHLQLLAADVKVNGSAVATLSKASVSINNNLKKDVYVQGGAGARRDLPRGRQEVTGSITSFFEDTTLRALAVAGTYVALDWTWTIAAASRTVRLHIPRVRLEINDPMAASDGPVQLTLPFRASKDSSTATQIRFITLNGNAGTLYSA